VLREMVWHARRSGAMFVRPNEDWW
jgi:hypothetical protein